MGLFDGLKSMFGPYDRIDTNPANGGTYWGKDNGEGYTSWYDSNGNLDSSTPTPSDDDCDPYQRRLEEGEQYHSKVSRRR